MRHLIFTVLLLLATAEVRAEEPIKVAFIDTGNTGRSVTAEALANALIAQKHLPILVISRAVDLNPYYVTPEANFVTLLSRRGIDVSAHRAAGVLAGDIRHSDLIFTMTAKHKATILAQFPEAAGKVFTLSEYTSGGNADVADAFGQPMPFYEETLRQIDALVPLALEKAAHK